MVWSKLKESGLLVVHRHEAITDLLVSEARRFWKTANMDSIFKRYIDASPSAMTGLIRGGASTGEQVAKLTTACRKKLAAARKVASQASA